MYKNGVKKLFVVNEKGTQTEVVSYSDLIDVLNQLSGVDKENNKNNS